MITRRNFNRIGGIVLTGSALFPVIPFSAGPHERLKVGQIGTGHSHAEGKMEALRRLKEVFDVVGISEPDLSLLEQNRNKSVYSGLKWLTVDELLHTRGLQAVLVETDLPDLLAIAEQCIEAGLPIHLDKPAGKDLARFKNIMSVAGQKNLVVQLGYMFRYNPAFEFCLHAVHKGWLGEIFEIDGVISKTISSTDRLLLADTYHGSMMLLGCHLIDMVVAILGEPAKIHGFRRQTHPELDNLNDNELAILEYQQATATVRSALVEVEGWERRQFVVCGTKGTIEIKPLEPPRLRLALEFPVNQYIKGYQEVELPPVTERYDDLLAHFALMVQEKVKPRHSKEHDLAVQKAVLEAAGLIK
jgi:predicted dehydrogenase